MIPTHSHGRIWKHLIGVIGGLAVFAICCFMGWFIVYMKLRTAKAG